ncbi:hypothetical protein [Sulfitobacter sabulilitoris]|uniref:Uncharacterized protein n=1 Tax=Sulfitobacter sabulilitoris TaxID=2562655 RepID=A0A5S3PCW2_9RHOB|nr:hypothetical protein [Sulfitobacter sabulilitoris]TMM51701.1 hypothetical protein FDT80_13190 [Sulfitobacter sabulilitoris]
MKPILFAGALPLLLGACASTPTPLPDVAGLQAPAFDQGAVTPVAYRNPLEGFENRAVTGPEDWRRLNQRQAPGQGGN